MCEGAPLKNGDGKHKKEVRAGIAAFTERRHDTSGRASMAIHNQKDDTTMHYSLEFHYNGGATEGPCGTEHVFWVSQEDFE